MSAAEIDAAPPRRPRLLGGLLRDPRAAAGLAVVALVVAVALTAPLLAPADPDAPDFLALMAPPSAAHPFGTDDLGRDVLSRVVFGARASVEVGLFSVVGALAAGTLAGLVAGYAGRWTDALVMRTMDVIFAFPSILLALVISAVLGPSLPDAVLAIAVVNVPIFARVARAQTLLVRELDFVAAQRGFGFPPGAILLRTVLPNVMAPLIVQASLLFASAIITESYLSFLGLGVQPPTPTWGSMLREAIGFLDQAPWLAWFPGLAIFVAVLGFNLLGDGLRDHLDPREAA